VFPDVGVVQLVPLCGGLAVRNGRLEGAALQPTDCTGGELVGVGKETIVAYVVT
jgi:hypothetical protein